MISKISPSKAIRTLLVLLALIGILCVEITLQAGLAQANNSEPVDARSGTRTPKPEKATRTPKPSKTPVGGLIWITPETHMLCGELVYLTSYSKVKPVAPAIEPTVAVIGLRRCDGKGILIFKTRPRDLIQFYQFRDAEIDKGPEICTEYCGCLDRYIDTFQNYIGLESCADCGVSMLPPTWTQVPLTPFTSTPIPPTRTPFPTPVTPTSSPTLAPGQVTPTLSLFEILQGSETPTSSVTPQSSSTLTSTSPTHAAISTLSATPVSSIPFYRRIGPVGLLLLALLAFLIPLAIVLRDYLRNR